MLLSRGLFVRFSRLPVLLGAATLAACGGGGGNGEYMAFLAEGQRYPLELSTDRAEYRFRDVPGLIASEGKFTAAGTPPVYTFDQQAGTGQTARFVTLDDLVIGNVALQARVTPFVAARSFVQSAAGAAGDYNVLGVTYAAGDYDSTLATWQIDAQGALKVCAATPLFKVANCPAQSLITYTLAASGDEFTATAAGGAQTLRFRVAQSGGERVLLLAQGSGTAGQFAIGLPDSTGVFRVGQSRGPSTDGAWSFVNHDATNYSSEGVGVNSQEANFSGTMAVGGPSAPAGVRNFESGNAYVMQNTRLTVVLGGPGSPGKGYLQIAVRAN